MSLIAEYRGARDAEERSRLQRALSLRAMTATGMTQREIATRLGVSQPAINQQLRHAPDLSRLDARTLLEAAAPVLTALAADRGFSDLAVFGSAARGEATVHSDIDLIVRPPAEASIRDLLALQAVFRGVLDRPVDLITYGALRPVLDDDIRRDLVML